METSFSERPPTLVADPGLLRPFETDSRGVDRSTVSFPIASPQALQDFSTAQGFESETLLIAAVVEVLDCYSPGDMNISHVRYCLGANVGGAPEVLAVAITSPFQRDPLITPPTVGQALESINHQVSQGVAELLDGGDADSNRSALQRNQLKGAHFLVSSASSGQTLQAYADDREHALVLQVSNGEGESPSLVLTFATSFLSQDFASILLQCIGHVLCQLPGDLNRPVSTLSLVPSRLEQRFSSLPGQPLATSPAEFVHELIEQQAASAPNAIASVFRDRALTYSDLVAQAKQLAQVLQSLGSRPGTLVGIHLGRSIELLTSILAVLQTGAAFVPLDASLPEGRITAVLTDSQTPLVVTIKSLAHRFENADVRLVLLDADPSSASAVESYAPVTHSPRDLAYVIYTSGSTGTPKGVMIEHRNLSAFLPAFDTISSPTSGTMLAISSASFDMSIVEILWTLSRGMRVVLHEGDEGAPIFSGPDSIAEQILRYGVTHLQATPTCMRILAEDPRGRQALGQLQVCMVGGEAFSPALAKLLLQCVSGRIVNGYGPTETTVCATSHLVSEAADPIPIGKALSNTKVYVVDHWKRLLPPLAPGELLIGGLSVGRGYLGRPELTAQRFINNPFDNSEDKRLYLTGDRVRLNLRGELEFIERIDSQVKIRGFRIELGEIESAIQNQPAVQHAAALVRPNNDGQPILAAFYTCVPGQTLTAEALRRELSRTLPHYMVPPVLRSLAELPRSSSGKIDRAALARHEVVEEPLDIRQSTKTTHSFPAADPELCRTEDQLCTWCGELLHLPVVRPTDDYFEIGGESLTAALLIRRIATEYGVDLRLSTLVKARTLRGLAAHLLPAAAKKVEWSPVVPFRTLGYRAPLFLIAGLGGNVINFDFVSRSLKNRPVYGVETQGLDANGTVLLTVEAMAKAYLAEMRKIVPSGPYHLAGYSFGGVVAFEIAQQLLAAGEQVGLVGLLDTSEWSYSRQALRQVGLLRRFEYMYGNTIRQFLFGSDRLATLKGRFRAAFEHRQLVRAQAKGLSLDASTTRPEQRNFHALAQYTPKKYRGAVHLFRTAEKTLLRGSDPTLGWSSLCSMLTVEEIAGEHETLTSSAFASSLASRLEHALLVAEHRDSAHQNRKHLRRVRRQRAA